MFATNGNKAVHAAAFLIIAALLTTGLYFARDLLFPLAVAFLIWFITASYRFAIAKLPFVGKHLSTPSLTIISFLIACFTLFVCGMVVMYSVGQFNTAYQTYSSNLQVHMAAVSELVGFDIESALAPPDTLSFESRLRNLFTVATGFFTTTVLVLFYLFFLYVEESTFAKKLKSSIPDQKTYKNVEDIISAVTIRSHRYLSLKTIISIGTGLAAYVILWLLGLDFALLAAFLIFLFNYIPYVGPYIGTGIAVFLALLQFSVIWPAVWVLVWIGIMQVISGNVVEPIMMGSRLNLSPLVIMVALAFWGYIWGIFGMFIAVPLTVMVMIVLAHIPQTRSIAVWMSENGDI